MAVCGGVVSLRVVDGLLAVLDLAPVLGRPFLPLAPFLPFLPLVLLVGRGGVSGGVSKDSVTS